ncbi:MAG: DUF4251 domain-containing protein [Bacteroidales bacterium]|nr:DUF4251 domain-containing protein [Bacteroidales bacterium]
MKTMKMNMVSLLGVFGLFLVSLNSNSQDIKLDRQERKEVRKAQMAANFYILDSLLNARSFVLEADYLQNKYGDRIPVVSNLNFIKVDRSNGILQTGSNFGMGYNGVGGVTAEGTIESWKISKDSKKLSYTLQFSLLTQIGHYDIFMSVNADNHASATITGLGPGRLTWDGRLKTLYNTRVFKGQNTI